MTAAGYAVVIITRDRPSYLEQFLKALDSALRVNRDVECLGVAIIDDSVDRVSRASNARSLRRFLTSAPGICVDREVQERLIREAGDLESRGLLRALGARSWCVGAARNTGALYWLTRNPGPVMIAFFDDDLLPIDGNHEWLARLVCECGRSGKIIGARITGTPDESRLDRRRRRLLTSERRSVEEATDDRHEAYPISGGCMVVPSELMRKNCFPLIYNEDWIFCLELVAEGATARQLRGPLLRQRRSRDKEPIYRLKQESVGQLAYRTMVRLPPNHRRLESVVQEEELWAEERARYCREILDVDLLSAQAGAGGGRRQHLDLGALRVWVAQLSPAQDSFNDHGFAKTLWRRKLLSQGPLRENLSGRAANKGMHLTGFARR
jgi:hypothetical protein